MLIKKRAFTLIELLVVISIIALLLSVLMPSLAKARGQARKVLCSSHLHSLNLIMLLYQNSYDVFPTVWWSNSSGYERELWWEPLVRARLLTKDEKESTEQNGYEDLKIDLSEAKAYTCPEWPRWAEKNKYTTDERYGMGYAYNWHFSPVLSKDNDVITENPEYLGKNPKGLLIVFIGSPSSFFMDAYHFRPYDPELKYSYNNGNIATWHDGSAVSAWSDGHVESMKADQYQEQMLSGSKKYTQ